MKARYSFPMCRLSEHQGVCRDSKPFFGNVDVAVASSNRGKSRWAPRFFVLSKDTLAWYTDRSTYEQGEDKWQQRLPLSHIQEFILAADEQMMEIVVTASPHPFRYRFRCTREGVLRRLAESAVLVNTKGSERNQYMAPHLTSAVGSAQAESGSGALQNQYPHKLVQHEYQSGSAFNGVGGKKNKFVSPVHPRSTQMNGRWDNTGPYVSCWKEVPLDPSP